jgi:DNA-directed RNA polymerase subunit E'/Rpb7
MPTERAIVLALESAFIHRVIPEVGLVISLYDIFSIGEGAVYHSDGGAHYKVMFRAVVFRPFPGELLLGTIRDMNE